MAAPPFKADQHDSRVPDVSQLSKMCSSCNKSPFCYLTTQTIAGSFLLPWSLLVSHFWRQILSPSSQTPLSPKAPFSGIWDT